MLFWTLNACQAKLTQTNAIDWGDKSTVDCPGIGFELTWRTMLPIANIGDRFLVKVQANAGCNTLDWDDKQFLIKTTAPPSEGRANDALVRLFWSLLDWRVEIVSGFKTKQKRIVVTKIKHTGANKHE